MHTLGSPFFKGGTTTPTFQPRSIFHGSQEVSHASAPLCPFRTSVRISFAGRLCPFRHEELLLFSRQVGKNGFTQH